MSILYPCLLWVMGSTLYGSCVCFLDLPVYKLEGLGVWETSEGL